MNDIPQEFNQKTMSWEERFIMSVVVLTLAVPVISLLFLLIQVISPANTSSRGRPPRHNQLKVIILSVHNHHDVYGGLPSAAIRSPDGNELHGWATPLLPYLDMEDEYDAIHLDKMWNDPLNQPVTKMFVASLKNPSIEETKNADGYSLNHYAANSRVIQREKALSFSDIKDGTSNTICLGEIAGHFQPWAAPGSRRDPAAGLGYGPTQFGMIDSETVVFALLDGSVRGVNRDIDPKILKALATPDGGEVVPADW